MKELKESKMSFKVTNEERERIERYAECMDIPMSYLIRRSIRDYMEAHPCRASDALTD